MNTARDIERAMLERCRQIATTPNRRAVRQIEADDSLPEYRFVVGHDDKVTFYVRDGARLARGLAKKIGK